MVHALSRHKPRIVLVLLGLGAVMLVSCNTTEGVGQDVENLGEGIQDAAD